MWSQPFVWVQSLLALVCGLCALTVAVTGARNHSRHPRATGIAFIIVPLSWTISLLPSKITYFPKLAEVSIYFGLVAMAGAGIWMMVSPNRGLLPPRSGDPTQPATDVARSKIWSVLVALVVGDALLVAGVLQLPSVIGWVLAAVSLGVMGAGVFASVRFT